MLSLPAYPELPQSDVRRVIEALHKFYPFGFDVSHINQLLVNQAAFKALQAGEDPHRIAEDWQDKLDKFMEIRAKYLLY